MKKEQLILSLLAVLCLSSFTKRNDCLYAGSNIDYVNGETQKAIDAEDINMSRFYAYKALNAIEKSKESLNSCACNDASRSIFEGLEQLKRATKSEDFVVAKNLLRKALTHTLGGLDALKGHKLHDSNYAKSLMSVDEINEKGKLLEKDKARLLRRLLQEEKGKPIAPELKKKIDQTLVKFENSVHKAVTTVECSEVRAFIGNTYQTCEKELFREDLSIAKRYFNLRTKEIISNGLAQLGECVDAEKL